MTMIFRFIFFAFLIYLAYKLVFELIIPLYHTTRKIKKGIREVQEQMGRQSAQPRQSTSVKQEDTGKGKPGDYIEFEEIK